MNKAEVLKQVEKKIKACETYLTRLKKKSAAARTGKPAR